MPSTKQAETEYLQRTAGGTWERYKPFSPPGTNTIEESSRLVLDFAVLLRCLQPAQSDLILDLGSGGGWCSDWLGRLNYRTVAVDISLDMLRVGRSRTDPRRTALAAGDFEALPFATGAFDKACCLSALHHVPDIPKALREIRRVLAPDGIALFAEPGAGHAESAVSVAAMRDCGVLEQDILVETFMRQCADAGFADVRIQPVAYILPEFDLTLDEWRAWERLTTRRRPWRALEKMGRAVLEAFGARKRGLLFDEAFVMRLARLLKGAMENHPIVVASKATRARSQAPDWLAEIAILEAPTRLAAGAPLALTVRLRNAGERSWPPGERPEGGCVRLGVQLLNEQRTLIDRDFHRIVLPHEVKPGEACTIRARLPAPAAPGSYVLKLDLVVEGATWFEVKGSAPAFSSLDVV